MTRRLIQNIEKLLNNNSVLERARSGETASRAHATRQRMCVCVYMCMYVRVYVCVCKRERERERDFKRGSEPKLQFSALLRL
jgi:hypothetical protein